MAQNPMSTEKAYMTLSANDCLQASSHAGSCQKKDQADLTLGVDCKWLPQTETVRNLEAPMEGCRVQCRELNIQKRVTTCYDL